MSRPPPDRRLVARAIEIVRQAHPELVTDDVNWLTASNLICFFNRHRDARDQKKEKYDLKQLVNNGLRIFGMDPGNQRVCEFIIMRYYTLASQLGAASRRRAHTPKSKPRKRSENTIQTDTSAPLIS